MAILSVKYPIIFTGSSSGFEYTIYQGSDTSGNVIYRGKSYGSEVDVSPVLQRFMNSDLVEVENVDLNTRDYNFSYELDSVVKTFTVSDGTTSQTFDVANDYNDKYILSYDSDYITSKSITGKYHPDSLIFIDVNSPDRTAVIASNVLPGSLSGFGSAHVTVKQNDVAGDGTIVEEINTNMSENQKTGIVYSGDKYVVVSTTQIYNSINLTTWGLASISGAFYNIIFANSLYMAVGYVNNNGYIYTSPNGIEWTQAFTFSAPFYDIANNGTTYVLASSGAIVFSEDGTNWNWYSNHTQTGAFTTVAYGAGVWVKFGKGIAIRSNNTLPWSASQWTTLNPIISTNFNCSRVRFVNNQFVAVGIAGQLAFGYYSADGISWNPINKNVTQTTYTGVAYGNGIYIFTASNGSIYYGNDLEAGLERIPLSSNSLNDVIFDGEKFVIVGNSNTIWTVEFEEAELSTITINGEEFPINYSAGCEKFSLYWANMLGGRSQLLLEGKHNSTYNNDWNRFKTNYDRTVPESFEHRTISNLVTRSWTLYTGILNDFQSEELRDLFNSPKVWLHDHTVDRIYSVVISDSSKRMKTQDVDHIYQYEINVDEAQTHIRR